MAATLDHETQAMGGREADGGRDVGGTLGRHRIDAGRRPPGVQPAGTFGEARLIGDIEGIGEELLRVGPVEVGRVDQRESAIGRLIEGGPLIVARPAGLTRPHTTERGGLSGGDPQGGGTGKCETGAEDIAAPH